MSRNRLASGVARFYVELMRSLPLLLLLLVMFYVVLASSSLNKTQIAIVCFSLYFGAYLCEIFRTGIEGVEQGQWEAGVALGMSRSPSWNRFRTKISRSSSSRACAAPCAKPKREKFS